MSLPYEIVPGRISRLCNVHRVEERLFFECPFAQVIWASQKGTMVGSYF